jgi:hypothetical protein
VGLQVAEAVHSIRSLDLKKPPSIGEALDWARTLLLLNANRLNADAVRAGLPVLIKNPSDRDLVLKNLSRILPTEQEEA